MLISLVCGLEHKCYFSIQLGMSSSELTNFIIFSEKWLNHQPDINDGCAAGRSQTCIVYIIIYIVPIYIYICIYNYIYICICIYRIYI